MATQSKTAVLETLHPPITDKVITKADFSCMVEANYTSANTQQESSEVKNAPSLPASPPLIPQSENAVPYIPAAFPESVPEKVGEGGEGGDLSAQAGSIFDAITPPLPALPPSAAASQVTNDAFIAAIVRQLPVGAHAAVCSKYGDPTTGGWIAKRADQVVRSLSDTNNNYLNCSSFKLGGDGLLHARKDNFAAYHLLMLDDIGTKIPFDRFGRFELCYLLETSPGNYQGGIILAEPITNGVEANRLLDAVIAAGLCDAGATGAQGRWARLPKGINGKAKHANAAGEPFQCRLIKWNPERVYTQQEVVDGLKLELAPVVTPKLQAASTTKTHDYEDDADDVFTPKSSENPVITELKSRGLYKTPLGSGKHDVTCPWVASADGLIHIGTPDQTIQSPPTKINGIESIGSSPKTAENTDKSKVWPVDIAKLASALAWLNPDCDEKTWKLSRIAPLARAAKNQPDSAQALYVVARAWSSGALCKKDSIKWVTAGGNGKTGEESFDGVWQRFINENACVTQTTLGTIYHDAKAAGWVNLHGTFAVLETEFEGVRA